MRGAPGAAGRPILGTPAEAYLRARGITAASFPALRFHPSVYYRAGDRAPLRRLPTMLAAITDLDGRVVGVNRTWLDVERQCLADLDAPRKVLGALLGHGVRFGRATDRLLAGEGIETVLSLKSVLPELPLVAALTANHLAALLLPPGLARLIIARDSDDAGVRAAARLRDRAEAQGVAVHDLVPSFDGFNEDLRRLGPARLGRLVRRLVLGRGGASAGAAGIAGRLLGAPGTGPRRPCLAGDLPEGRAARGRPRAGAAMAGPRVFSPPAVPRREAGVRRASSRGKKTRGPAILR